MITKISLAKSLRGDTARVSGSLTCTSNRGRLRVFIQLQNRKTSGVHLGISISLYNDTNQCRMWENILADILYESLSCQSFSNFSLTTSVVLSAAHPLLPPPCSHFVHDYSECFASPRWQRVWQSLSDRCSSDRAWIHHPPLAPWCEVEAVWPPGPARRTGSCRETTPCGCPGSLALRGRHGRQERWHDEMEMALFKLTCDYKYTWENI